jgi:hypothetical protein
VAFPSLSFISIIFKLLAIPDKASILFEVIFNPLELLFRSRALASPQYTIQIPNNFPPGKYTYRATYHTLHHGVQIVDHTFWVQDSCPLFRILTGVPTIDYYYNGIDYVHSYQTLNNGLEFLYRSEKEIIFKQGFHAKTGVKLEAEIDASCEN